MDNENAASIDSKTGVLTAKQTSAFSTLVTVKATALDGSNVVGEKVIKVKRIVTPENVTIDQAYAAENGYYCAQNEQTLNLNYTTHRS